MHKPWQTASAIGSLPLVVEEEAVEFVFSHLLEVPHWPQLPQRSSREGLISQFISPLLRMGLVAEEEGKYRFVDDADNWTELITAFYELVLRIEGGDEEALEEFFLPVEVAPGFYRFCERLREDTPAGLRYLKGQVSGPVTMGFRIQDSQKRPCFYSNELRDILLQSLALQARWQIKELGAFGLPVIIFFDDPGIYAYGQSASVGLSGEDITSALTYLFSTVQKAGAVAGVHACAGVEWSLVFRANPDIINVDVYDYFPSLLLCAEELDYFLKEGGTLAWGLVPTGEEIEKETAASLWQLFAAYVEKLRARGVSKERLENQWLLTPSCGTGTMDAVRSKRVYSLLGEMLQNREVF